MSGLNSVVAVYKTQADAEDGVLRLQKAEYDLKTVSLVGKEHDSGGNIVGYYHILGHMKYWGSRSLFWNGIWRMLQAAAYFNVPGIGGVLLAGPLTAWFVAALDQPVEGLSAVGSSLYNIGIPRASVLRYDSAIKMHKLILIAHGVAKELLKARDLLHDSRPEEIDIHFAEAEVRKAA